MKSKRLWIYAMICRILPETRLFELKAILLRWCGAKIGKNVRISSSARFFGGGQLIICDDVWIGTDCVIHSVSKANIKIGDCCDLGPGVMILTGSHEIDSNGSHIAGKGTFSNVEIGEGCWIGARSLILPGVSLPQQTLVAAGAVVTHSPLLKQMLIAGVPAQSKRSLLETK